MKILNQVRNKIFIFGFVLIIFNIFETLQAVEIVNLSEKATLIKKLEFLCESQNKSKNASLVYNFSVYQNNVYMADRVIADNLSESEEKDKTDFSGTTYLFNMKMVDLEIIKSISDFGKNTETWFNDTCQKRQFRRYLENAKFYQTPDLIFFSIKFKKSDPFLNEGEQIFILGRRSLKLLGIINIIRFDKGVFVSLNYSRELSVDEALVLKGKKNFKSGVTHAKSWKEMKFFILELAKETPSLLKDFPWLLEKEKVPVL